MPSYNRVFSEYYDRLTDDVDRHGMTDFCIAMMGRYHEKCELVLDLACGTGTLCTEFARRGIETIGVDASADMLSEAMEKNTGLEVPVLYLCQPLERLDLYGTVDLAVCTLDSLNHLKGKRALEKALHRLQYFVEPGGLFIFDMNTPYKHRAILGNNTFLREAKGVYCAWQSEYTIKENRVELRMDLFTEQADGSYTRTQEHFCEYAYEQEEIRAMLSAEHFNLLAVYDGYAERAPAGDTERWVFVAQREGEKGGEQP